MKRRVYRAVLFDLDGTLVDTMEDIAGAANYALAALGRAPDPLEAFRSRVGWGIGVTMEKSLPGEPAERIAQGLALFREEYGRHPCVRTTPYPGIPALLERLARAGKELYVYTNKPEEQARRIADRLFGPDRFNGIFGAVPQRPLKPHPEGIQAVLETLGHPAEELAYVGDSEVDMETAAAGGIDAWAVTWGYRSEEELRGCPKRGFVRSPEEISAIILGDSVADPTGSSLE